MKTISFTGGYGAQIISTAAYYYLQKNNNKVGADFVYFNNPPHHATPGILNEISQWKWEMDNFGIEIKDFYQPSLKEKYDIVYDGPEKMSLGFSGLRENQISTKFNISSLANSYRKEVFDDEKYACVHIRRGDYLNVASYIIEDEVFLRVIKKISELVKNLLIVSDTSLNSNTIFELSKLKINCITAIGGDPDRKSVV